MSRTITNPATDSSLSSSVIRNELQLLEDEVANTTSGHDHDGTDSKLLPSSSVTPAGSNTQVQFNDSGALAGDAGFVYNKTTDIATLVGLNLSGLTASQITATDGSKNLVSLAVATYPSLTELSYVKGVTSAIQTQLNTKGTGNVTKVGTPANNQIGVWTGDGTIEGDTGLTWTGSALNVTNIQFYNSVITTTGADSVLSILPISGTGLLYLQDGSGNASITLANGQVEINAGTGGSQQMIFEQEDGVYKFNSGTGAVEGVFNFASIVTTDKTFTFPNLTGTIGVFSTTANAASSDSGVYTPTRSAEANMDSNVTMFEAQYMRVGNTVAFSGRYTADPTLTATVTSFEMTLPVASNIGAVEDLAGVAVCGAIAGMCAQISGVVANDTMKVSWISTDVTAQSWSFTGTYQVI